MTLVRLKTTELYTIYFGDGEEYPHNLPDRDGNGNINVYAFIDPAAVYAIRFAGYSYPVTTSVVYVGRTKFEVAGTPEEVEQLIFNTRGRPAKYPSPGFLKG